ncbi:diadenylate cyclase [Bacteroidetes bacterium endosymbiont of Geopemphigus sp.]|uniref:diadenylate cyclase n=1 Tax=Bacteroidetes bacterium endosymbiont of Geopemphigus sp. TaxID=2047937 RepID=UPI001F4D56D5|nr:diadenylate cyclase [Bacteroidetes bacterium endosymbiont of Geopemphigus sp.]
MDFLRVSVADFFNIFLVAIVFFQIYRLFRNTLAPEIFYGIIASFVIWKMVRAFKMELLAKLLGTFFNMGFLALMILFQPEIRKFLLILSNRTFIKRLTFFNYRSQNIPSVNDEVITQIIDACAVFSGDKTGALIVLKNKVDLDESIQNGDMINAKVSTVLLESIFYKNGPLHDGAVVIADNKIVRTRAVLPVSYNKDIPSRLGLRHRAAMGLSERTDAICIVVSEETGYISYIRDQKRILISSIDNLKKKLREDLNTTPGLSSDG